MQVSKRILNGIKNVDKVAEGIYNFHNPSEDIENLAIERAKICSSCPHYVDENNDFFKVSRAEVENDLIKDKSCNLCGCVLSYKLRTKKIEKKENCLL